MTNEEIESRIFALVPQERKITGEILCLIVEAEKRKLPLRNGYPSTFEWLVKKFGYSQAAAYRRIQAARVLREYPGLKAKLETGALNLSLVVQVQKAVKKEEKRTKEKLAVAEKVALLEKIEGKSMEAAERIIKERFPELRFGKDSLRRLNEDESRLSAIVDNQCVEDLKRAKEVLSHRFPQGRWGEIIGYTVNQCVAAEDPLQKLTHPVTATLNHRVITPALRAMVLRRAGGRCEFLDEGKLRRCESRHQLEVDHIRPRALGGGNEFENLRALCRAHNLYEAERVLGPH